MSQVPDTGHKYVFLQHTVGKENLFVGQGTIQVIFRPRSDDGSITEGGTHFCSN